MKKYGFEKYRCSYTQAALCMLAVLGVAGCPRPATETCDDGLRCPLGTMCIAVNEKPACVDESCGDGFVDSEAGEQCDDGNHVSGDGCRSDCRSNEMCGNAVVDKGEQCDEGGNTLDCDENCTWAGCGDGFFNAASGEQCDDGNLEGADFCNNQCATTTCIDGIRNADEIDVDCGGRCPPRSCRSSQTCNSDLDCGSGPCIAGRCSLGRLVAGGAHTCALLDTGKVRCWGSDYVWQLGYGSSESIGDNEPPISAGDVNVGGRVVQLVAGGGHTCALLDTGKVRCWGYGVYGQLGHSSTSNIRIPAPAGDVDVGGTVIQLAAGREHTCALLDMGKVRCWGYNGYGQLGYGNTNNVGDDETPASAGDVDVGGKVVQLAAGDGHTCALLDTGKIRCWGYGRLGQLGYGNTDSIGDDEQPYSAGDVDVGATVVQVIAGGRHTCVLLHAGKVRCWGNGDNGRLGYGNTFPVLDAALAGDVDIGGTAVLLTAGANHTCARLDTDKVRCWGNGNDGRLGYGNTNNIGDNETPASAGDVFYQ